MSVPLLCRLRLQHKTSAWTSGGLAGGRRLAQCLGRWHALPLRGPTCRFQRPNFRWITFLNYASTNLEDLGGEGDHQTPETGHTILLLHCHRRRRRRRRRRRHCHRRRCRRRRRRRRRTETEPETKNDESVQVSPSTRCGQPFFGRETGSFCGRAPFFFVRLQH